MKLTAVFQKVAGGYVGFVEELPGANTQGRTLAEVRSNLAEAGNSCWKPTGNWRRSPWPVRTPFASPSWFLA